MISELISTCIFIFMAEMGDKTQILAMTFATKYSTKQVLLGVFLGSLLNHGMAIFLGFYLSKSISLTLLQLAAACCFIIFGLLGLKPEEEEEEKVSCTKCGPISTVAIAFFIGELGDKTQLTSMTLATQGNYPFFILLGAISGMLLTSGLAIWAGCKLCKKIPPAVLKLASSYVFIILGVSKLWKLLPKNIITPWPTIIFLGSLIVILMHLFKPFIAKSISKDFLKTK